ncbi:MAG: hypothetical protein G01um101433_492 [Parcubacteria group bacterium Gr01-1014_33]|nr:MAG: hypothetical protein G01um101433_492 [Parcubacteria group bacterium Gr01-1014_33]
MHRASGGQKLNPVRNSRGALKSPRELLQAVTHAAERRGIISNRIKEICEKIAPIGRQYDLRFIILYGSHAKGTEAEESDMDIAILRDLKITAEDFMNILRDLETSAGAYATGGIDLVLLHNADPLLRHLVARDGILLYGNPTAYEEFKAFAFRAFLESEDLRRLELVMIRAKQDLLTRKYGTTLVHAGQ